MGDKFSGTLHTPVKTSTAYYGGSSNSIDVTISTDRVISAELNETFLHKIDTAYESYVKISGEQSTLSKELEAAIKKFDSTASSVVQSLHSVSSSVTRGDTELKNLLLLTTNNLQKEQEALVDRITTLAEDVDKNLTSQSEADREILNLITVQRQNIEAINKRLTSFASSKDVQSLQVEVSNIKAQQKNQSSILSQTASGLTKEIEERKATDKNLQDAVDTINENVTLLDEKSNSAQSSIKTINSTVNKVQSDIQSIEIDVKNLQVKDTSITQSVNQNKADIKALQEDTNRIGTTAQIAYQSTQNLWSEAESHRVDIQELQDGIKKLPQDNVVGLTDKLNSLQNKDSTIDKKVSELQTALNAESTIRDRDDLILDARIRSYGKSLTLTTDKDQPGKKTLTLWDNNEFGAKALSSVVIDLDVESIITEIEYVEEENILKLTLSNGHSVSIPLSEATTGLMNVISTTAEYATVDYVYVQQDNTRRLVKMSFAPEANTIPVRTSDGVLLTATNNGQYLTEDSREVVSRAVLNKTTRSLENTIEARALSIETALDAEVQTINTTIEERVSETEETLNTNIEAVSQNLTSRVSMLEQEVKETVQEDISELEKLIDLYHPITLSSVSLVMKNNGSTVSGMREYGTSVDTIQVKFTTNKPAKSATVRYNSTSETIPESLLKQDSEKTLKSSVTYQLLLPASSTDLLSSEDTVTLDFGNVEQDISQDLFDALTIAQSGSSVSMYDNEAGGTTYDIHSRNYTVTENDSDGNTYLIFT